MLIFGSSSRMLIIITHYAQQVMEAKLLLTHPSDSNELLKICREEKSVLIMEHNLFNEDLLHH